MQPSLSRFAYYPKGKYPKVSIVVKNIFSESKIPIEKNYYSKEILKFNQLGKISHLKRIDRNRKETEIYYRYDEKNNLTFINEKVWKYTFDKAAKKITVISDNKINKWEKEYDDKNRRIKSSYFINEDLGSYDICAYDEEDRILEWFEYDTPLDDYGNATNEGIQLISKRNLSYTKQFDNKTLCLLTDFDLIDEITSKEIFIINPDLTVDCHKYLDKNGNVTSEIKYQYEYDEKDLIAIKETQISYHDHPKGRNTGIKYIQYTYE